MKKANHTPTIFFMCLYTSVEKRSNCIHKHPEKEYPAFLCLSVFFFFSSI